MPYHEIYFEIPIDFADAIGRTVAGGRLSARSSMATDAIECPLCLGEGKLKRTEVLDRLGVKDFARLAQLSAEEAFRLLLQKHHHDEQTVWARFETELTKRTSEIERRHGNQLQPMVENSNPPHMSLLNRRHSTSNASEPTWRTSSVRSSCRRRI